MAKPEVPGDVVFTLSDGGVLASNHRARTHVWLSHGLFRALSGEPPAGELAADDRTRFSCYDGLLADPTGLDRVRKDKTVFDSFEAALPLLRKRMIVTDPNGRPYGEFFAPKTSLIDAKHSGTFHQQLGAELRLRRREDPNTWWHAQKFDPATGRVRENLYKYVQEKFLERYFASLDLKGKTVLDFGCGSGMASRRFRALGARVIGVDPDEEFLGRAKASVGEGFTPVLMRLDAPDPLAALPDEPVDFVWLADVFMFYFHPQDAGAPLMPPGELLKKLTRRLAPGGRCVIMQPHGVFWLAAWLGDPERPYTVLTEYARKVYSVAPRLEALSAAAAEAGLAIARIFEPLAEGGPGDDPRAREFALEFPQWWVFECVRRS